MKLRQYQQELQKYKLEILSLEKLKKQQQSLEKQLHHTELNIQKYEQELKNGRKKLNKLDGFSFVNVFYNWIGKQQELQEERYDLLATAELKLIEAQLMYEDLNDDLVDTIYKINAINEEYLIAQIKEIENKIQVYYMANNHVKAAQLNQVLEQQFLLQQLLIEIHEAIVAGKEAQKELTEAAKALSNANNYSTWDLLGGGFIVTTLKHEKLDQSKAYLHRAQIALQRFQNELLDIQEIKNDTLQVDTDGFVKFADFFFDDIFSAWSIHSKISTSTNQISRVLDDVSNTLIALQQKVEIAERKKEQLSAEKDKLISNE
ncbi:hypothetical protein [Lysinibacillus sp. 54212]|uniref:hypothetical protein n=1 Tax=Lysinibacillus sp. 54212 TaxID=3119829 RepID=UPI002FC8C0BF